MGEEGEYPTSADEGSWDATGWGAGTAAADADVVGGGAGGVESATDGSWEGGAATEAAVEEGPPMDAETAYAWLVEQLRAENPDFDEVLAQDPGLASRLWANVTESIPG